MVERSEAKRSQPAFSVSDHIVGKDRVSQHRNVPKHIVKDVWLLQIIQLLGRADEVTRRKAPIGEMVEKNFVGHKSGDGHNLPTCGRHQACVQFTIIGNAGAC